MQKNGVYVLMEKKQGLWQCLIIMQVKKRRHVKQRKLRISNKWYRNKKECIRDYSLHDIYQTWRHIYCGLVKYSV